MAPRNKPRPATATGDASEELWREIERREALEAEQEARRRRDERKAPASLLIHAFSAARACGDGPRRIALGTFLQKLALHNPSTEEQERARGYFRRWVRSARFVGLVLRREGQLPKEPPADGPVARLAFETLIAASNGENRDVLAARLQAAIIDLFRRFVKRTSGPWPEDSDGSSPKYIRGYFWRDLANVAGVDRDVASIPEYYMETGESPFSTTDDAESTTSPACDEPDLTPKEATVLLILAELAGRTGLSEEELGTMLEGRLGDDDGYGSGSIRRSVIPKLKAYGVESKRPIGYRVKEDLKSRAREVALSFGAVLPDNKST